MMRSYLPFNIISSASSALLVLAILSANSLGCQESALSVSMSQRSQGSERDDTRTTPTTEPAQERVDINRPALDEQAFTLGLELVERSADHVVTRLTYLRRDEQVAPRTAEIFLEYPEELTITQVKSLEATERAEKDLIIQHPSPGRTRLIWMSVGHLGTIDSGPLAEITLRGRPSARSAIHILSLPNKPWFAPPAANEGVSISEPLLFGLE